MKKILSLVLVIALAIGCFSFSSAEELKVYHDYQTTTNEMEYWLIQMSQGAKELNVLNNCLDGLVYNDNTGALVGLAAHTWEHDDESVVWTFHLRDNMVWVDANGEYKGDVVAEDWLTGLEWTLNYAKNEATNTSMAFETLKGAEEYYEYTKALTETNPEEAAALTYEGKFLETVGISTPDEYTIVYTCKDSTPYFDSVATYACLYPLPQGMIDELGVEGTRALTPDKMWYSGPYTVTTYNEGSEKILTRNPLYWNEESKLFDEVVITMVESVDKAKELFDAGQLDRVALSQSALTTIYNDPDNPYYKYLVEARPTKYSYQMHLNYDVWEEDGTPDTNWNTAIANEAFRLSWYKEFTSLVAEARTIVDDYDARLDAFAKSEAYFVQHALTIPCYIDISWQLTKVNDYTKCYAAYGISTYRYENWETNSEMYTTEEYEAIKAAYNAAE